MTQTVSIERKIEPLAFVGQQRFEPDSSLKLAEP
jgi:hypothetical protein